MSVPDPVAELLTFEHTDYALDSLCLIRECLEGELHVSTSEHLGLRVGTERLEDLSEVYRD